MHTTIRQQFFYTHPVESVWEYLTKAELISQWLMPNDFQLIPGHEFQFRVKPMPVFNLDGIFHCKILEIVPLKKLSYSWKGGPGNGVIALDSIVVWTLVEKENGTELQLEQTGFKDPDNLTVFSAMEEGWLSNMKKIAERLTLAQHDTSNT